MRARQCETGDIYICIYYIVNSARVNDKAQSRCTRRTSVSVSQDAKYGRGSIEHRLYKYIGTWSAAQQERKRKPRGPGGHPLPRRDSTYNSSSWNARHRGGERGATWLSRTTYRSTHSRLTYVSNFRYP